MELLPLLIQTAFDWIRDVLVGVSGQCAEEVVTRRLKRRRRKKKRKPRGGTRRA